MGLLYYAGHGIQVRGKNYLIPIDANIAIENDVALAALDLEVFQQAMEDAGVRLSLFILDACRDNPFERRFRSAGSHGLAPVDAARGTLIAFATAPGKTAADGSGDHGLYTAQLLMTIVKPGLTLEEVLKEIAEAVERASGNRQTPWYNSAFHGQFYFTSAPNVAKTQPEPVAKAEVVFWETIKGSQNPADFEAYLKQFPEGIFATLAKGRIAMLKAPPLGPSKPEGIFGGGVYVANYCNQPISKFGMNFKDASGEWRVLWWSKLDKEAYNHLLQKDGRPIVSSGALFSYFMPM